MSPDLIHQAPNPEGTCLTDSFQINILGQRHSKLSLDLICRRCTGALIQKFSVDYLQAPTQLTRPHALYPRGVNPLQRTRTYRNTGTQQREAYCIIPPSTDPPPSVTLHPLPVDIRLVHAQSRTCMICVPSHCNCVALRLL